MNDSLIAQLNVKVSFIFKLILKSFDSVLNCKTQKKGIHFKNTTQYKTTDYFLIKQQ